MEEERRFLVPHIPDGLDDDDRKYIVQCYPEKEAVHISDGSLMLGDEMLVEGGIDKQLITASERKAVALLLDSDPHAGVRLRLHGEKAWVTVKGEKVGGRCPEVEWEVPPDRIHELVENRGWPSIRKWRYILPASHGYEWEVDCFLGGNAGLIIAEIELKDIEDDIELPDWLGLEVTTDSSWSNYSLAHEPRPQDS